MLRTFVFASILLGLAAPSWLFAGTTQIPPPPPIPAGGGGSPLPANPTASKPIDGVGARPAGPEARPDERLPDLETVTFVLEPGRTEIPPVICQIDLDKIGLPADLRDVIGAEGVKWDLPPDLSVELNVVEPEKGAETRPPLRLTLEDSPVPHEIEVVATLDKLIPGKPGSMTFRIVKPSEVRARVGAGVFRGELELKLYHKKWPNKGIIPIRMKVPIEVVIPGHRLIRFDLLNRRDVPPALSVGQPLTATVVVETIGVDLGAGRVQLSWVPEGGSLSERVTLIDVQVPLPPDLGWKTPVLVDVSVPSPTGAGASAPIEVGARAYSGKFMVWDPIDARRGWSCHPSWADEGIITTWPVDEPMSMPKSGLSRSRHRIDLVLPDLFAPGSVTGTVWWNPPKGVKDEASISRDLSEKPLRVGSGLWISPRTAARGELVTIAAVISEQDCQSVGGWSEVLVNRGSPDGTSRAIALERKKVIGSRSHYFTGEIQPETTTPIKLEVSAEDNSEAALKLASTKIPIPFQFRMNLPSDRPLVLFKDAPPIYWWPLYGDDHDGKDKNLWREEGMVFSPVARDAVLRSSGIFTVDATRRRSGVRLASGHEAPKVWFSDPAIPNNLNPPSVDWFPTDEARDKAAASVPGDDPKEEPSSETLPPRQWRVQSGSVKALRFCADTDGCDLDKLPSGTRTLVARWLVAGVDEFNRPYARIIQRPFGLKVATGMDYYLSTEGALMALGALLVVGIGGWLFVFILKGITKGINRPAHAVAKTAGVGDGGGSGFVDDPLGSPLPHAVSRRPSTEERRLDQEDALKGYAPEAMNGPIVPDHSDDGDPFGGTSSEAGAIDPLA